MKRDALKLSPRLLACAERVRNGSKFIDVGTDHGYLPIWLVSQGIISEAIALDVKKGPLSFADRNIKKYNVEDQVKTLLSDGLNNVCANDADDIVIAGMGADVIIKIIEDAPWLKNSKKQLILQPMSHEERLRKFLTGQRFFISHEESVKSQGKIYVVITCNYTGKNYDYDDIFPYVGKVLETESCANLEYLEKTIRKLENQSKAKTNNKDLLNTILKLKEVLNNVKNQNSL